MGYLIPVRNGMGSGQIEKLLTRRRRRRRRRHLIFLGGLPPPQTPLKVGLPASMVLRTV